jgi:hypothetical protein
MKVLRAVYIRRIVATVLLINFFCFCYLRYVRFEALIANKYDITFSGHQHNWSLVTNQRFRDFLHLFRLVDPDDGDGIYL